MHVLITGNVRVWDRVDTRDLPASSARPGGRRLLADLGAGLCRPRALCLLHQKLALSAGGHHAAHGLFLYRLYLVS